MHLATPLKQVLYQLYERQLLGGIRQRPVPRHLGLIQDNHRRYARHAGLSSIQRLADRAGVSRITVFRIESGRSSPTVAVLEKLAGVLTIHMGDFFPRPSAARRSGAYRRHSRRARD